MPTPIGQITIVHGNATATADDAVRPLHVGDPVFEDDLIITKGDSAVEIRFADDTVLAQGANSELLLDQYTYNPASGDGKLAFDMIQGTFRSVTGAIVDHNPQNFELGSPLATIGIRGTTTAHIIPPAWAADATEDHVVIVYDGKPVLVTSTADGEVRFIDTSGHKVEISDLGLTQVTVMTVAEYLYFEQLATAQLSGQEPVYDSPDDVIQEDPNTDRPVEGPGTNQGDLNTGQENQGDHNSGDTPQENAEEAKEQLVETIDSLIMEGNAGESLLDGGSLLLGDGELLLHGTSSGLETLQSILNSAYNYGQAQTLIDAAITPVESYTSGQTTVSIPNGQTSVQLDSTQLANGVVITPPAGTGPFTITLTGDASITAGTSVSVDLSAFSASQEVSFDASSIIGGGYVTVTGGSGVNKINGTNHNPSGDTITGGGSNDILKGFYGNDTINGGDGDDEIWGLSNSAPTSGSGSDNDTLNGGAGNDHIYGNIGDDIIHGGTGDDYLYGNMDGSSFGTGSDNDTIYGDSGADHIYGNEGNDTLYGGEGDDIIDGGEGNNVIYGGTGADTLSAGYGDDTYVYAGTADISSGERINDMGGTDTIRVTGDTNFSSMIDGVINGIEKLEIAANFTATFSPDQFDMWSGQTFVGADNALQTVETVVFELTSAGTIEPGTLPTLTHWGSEDIILLKGSTGDDTFTFGSNYNTHYHVDGGDGSDILNVDSGSASSLAHISNVETINFTNGSTPAALNWTLATGLATSAMTIDFSALTQTENTNTLNASAATGDLTVKASTSAQATVTTGGGNDTITGAGLADTLSGGAGNDTITGGGGADTLSGGTGDDTFIYAGASDVVSGETIDGGTGTDSISVTSSTDFSDIGNGITSIEKLYLSDGSTATFKADQLSIWNGKAIFGSTTGADTEAVIFNMTSSGTLDLTNFATLNTWGSGNLVTINGTANSDTFTFGCRYSDAFKVVAGQGTDHMSFTSDGTTTYTLANLSGVEEITLGDATTTIATNGHLVDGLYEFIFDASALSSNHALSLDASGETEGMMVRAGAGANTISTGSGNDTIDFDDSVFDTSDTVNGGGGNDTLEFTSDGSTTYTLTGVTNVETIQLGDAASTSITLSQSMGVATGVTFDFSNVTGTVNFDGHVETNAMTFSASEGINHITGGSGNDVFNFTINTITATDIINGGDGSDTLNISGDTSNLNGVTGVEKAVFLSDSNYNITLADSVVSDTGSMTFDFSALTSSFSATFNGSAETGGSLIIKGGQGSDYFTSGGGADNITTDTGNDIIRYNAFADGGDTITDFATGADKISFNSAVFDSGAQTLSGNYGGDYGNVVLGTTDAYLILDLDSGKLWYDENGSTSGGDHHMATVNNPGDLNAGSDIIFTA